MNPPLLQDDEESLDFTLKADEEESIDFMEPILDSLKEVKNLENIWYLREVKYAASPTIKYRKYNIVKYGKSQGR